VVLLVQSTEVLATKGTGHGALGEFLALPSDAPCKSRGRSVTDLIKLGGLHTSSVLSRTYHACKLSSYMESHGLSIVNFIA
jgi:hypothetical protein